MNTFKEIFSKYDTDKTDNFSEAYNQLFTPIRNDIQLIFEIGVNRGGSIRAWKEFFPNAKIVGMDIEPNTYFEDDRISIEIGDASDKFFALNMIKKYGYPDILIDDGSHFSSDIKKSLEIFFPYVKKCYVIEDIGTQTNLYKNGFYINDNAPATNNVCENAVSLMCQKDFDIKSIHIYYSICFMFKKEII